MAGLGHLPSKKFTSVKPSGTTMLITSIQSIRFEEEKPYLGPWLKCATCGEPIYWGFVQEMWFHLEAAQRICWWGQDYGRDAGAYGEELYAEPEGWQEKLV